MDITSFQTSLEHWGYLLVFFASFGGGYTVIVATGIFCALGKLDISLSLLVSSLGNFVGSSLLVYLSRTQKKDFTKFLRKHKRKLALCHIYMRKYGVWLLFFSKFIYGFKTVLPIAIGLSHYSFKKFCLYNIPACAVFTTIVGLVSFFASHWTLEFFSKFGGIAGWKITLVVICIFVVIFFAFKLVKTIKR